jgi:hypothetical protein
MDRLPSLDSPTRSASEYAVSAEGIADLFYDGLNDPVAEHRKLQLTLDMAKYKSILKKMYTKKSSMNRSAFRKFMMDTTEIDGDVPDEIFSCAVNDFSELEGGPLPDRNMTKAEFATAVVRVANLWALMNEGMVNSSELSDQTARFLTENEALV